MPATARAPALDAERLQIAYDLLRATVASGELPSALLAVADGRELLRCEAHGPDGPLPTDGIYLLASITKPIVATAVMQLVEQGKLLIEDPVARHIPEFAANGKQDVQLWHLLTHTSGLDDGYQRELAAGRPDGWLPQHSDDLAGVIATFLRFPPGSRVEYCNVSFTILGELIRRASGLPYPEYLRRHAFVPAGMRDTSFNPGALGAAEQARVLPVHDFIEFPGGLPGFISLELPAGGLFSTAADLAAFGQAFLNGGRGRAGRLLSPAAIEAMTWHHTAGLEELAGSAAGPAHRALGWALPDPRRGRLWRGYGHGGATGTLLWIDPAAGLVIVFLTNRWGWDGRARTGIVNAVLAAVE